MLTNVVKLTPSPTHKCFHCNYTLCSLLGRPTTSTNLWFSLLPDLSNQLVWNSDRFRTARASVGLLPRRTFFHVHKILLAWKGAAYRKSYIFPEHGISCHTIWKLSSHTSYNSRMFRHSFTPDTHLQTEPLYYTTRHEILDALNMSLLIWVVTVFPVGDYRRFGGLYLSVLHDREN
jgi:hypothetical protein